MVRFRVRGLLAALTAGAAAPLVIADDPPAGPRPVAPPPSYLSRLNPFGKAEPPPAPPPRPARVAPLSPEAMVEAVQAEKDAYSRRLEICTQLRRVANDKNDARLEADALALEQLAETTYTTRMAKLGVQSGPRNKKPLGPPIESIDAALGTGTAVNPLTTGRPTAPTAPATAQVRKFKEVNP